MNILIVEDEFITRKKLEEDVRNLGYKTLVAVDGIEGWKIWKNERPRLVITDWIMPGMNGPELCGKIKEAEGDRYTYLIIITSKKDVHDVVIGMDAGADDFILKPFVKEDLAVRIRAGERVLSFESRLVKAHTELTEEINERKQTEDELQKANMELERLASMDGLTQVANRRLFDQYLNQEWSRMNREQLPLSLIMCDIDFFKLYNDTYGHQSGDDCLRDIAQAISMSVRRPGDLVARYGGEEFVVILPGTYAEGAVHIAETIRTEIQRLKIVHEGSPVNRYVTLTWGVSSVSPCREFSPDALVEVADRALYEGKEHGRNCVILKTLGDCSNHKVIKAQGIEIK